MYLFSFQEYDLNYIEISHMSNQFIYQLPWLLVNLITRQVDLIPLGGSKALSSRCPNQSLGLVLTWSILHT